MQFRNYHLIRSELISVTAYLLMLVLYFVISFIPDNRLWGFNWWGYFPIWVPIVLLGTGLCLPIILYSLFHVYDKTKADDKTENVKIYYYFSSVIIIIVALSFYFFRVKTHFLGDGYQLLSRLTEGSIKLKFWDIGTSLATEVIYSQLSRDNSERALIAFQISSILAGIIFLIEIFYISLKLFESNTNRILFSCGIISGGYILLFFGYVENYSLFVSSVTLLDRKSVV